MPAIDDFSELVKEVFLLPCGLGIAKMSGRNGISETLSYLVPEAGAEGSAMGHGTRAPAPLSSHFQTCKNDVFSQAGR